MNKTYICGIVASGKGIVRPLLDGHPQVITCPFQGLGMSFITQDFVKQLTRETLLSSAILREQDFISRITLDLKDRTVDVTVGDVMAYVLTRDVITKHMDNFFSERIVAASSQENQRFVEFKLNFFKFIEDYTEKIGRNKGPISPEGLQDVFYETFISHWKNRKGDVKPDSSFVQSASNGMQPIEDILARNDQGKILVVMRDPVALSFTNAERARKKSHAFKANDVYQGSFFSKYLYNPYEAQLNAPAFIDKVRQFRDKVKSLAKTRDNIHIIRFEELIFDTKKTMDGVADFLRIEKNEILYRATLNGESLETSDVKFTGKMNDDPYRDLAGHQVDTLKHLYGEPLNGKSLLQRIRVQANGGKWRLIHLLKKIKNA